MNLSHRLDQLERILAEIRGELAEIRGLVPAKSDEPVQDLAESTPAAESSRGQLSLITVEAVDRKFATFSSEIVKYNRRMITRLVEESQAKVYSGVMTQINTQLVPQLEKAVEWVNYSLEDTDRTVSHYREEIDEVSRESCAGLIGDSDHSHIISEHVKLFFDNNH
jgi:hypothetical protein